MLKASSDLWDATLLVLRPGYPFAREVAASGVAVIELGARPDWDPRRLLDLRRIARSGDFDVVHSSLWGANALVRLALIGRRDRRTAVVVSERRAEPFRSWPARFLDRLLRPSTDAFIGNSKDVCEFVVQHHGVSRERVHLVPNGIDPAVFYPLNPSRARHQPPRVGTLGRLIPIKGFDVFIEAAKLVIDSVPAEFFIVGDGPERESLRTQIGIKPIHLSDPIEDPKDVGDYLRSLDLFVLPSWAEGLPNVVLEARACGVPVITTDAPGMDEAAPDSRKVPAGDATALAKAIMQELQTPTDVSLTQLPSFRDAAAAHARVFELSIRRRRAGSQEPNE